MPMTKKRKVSIAVLSVVALLVIARLVAPYVITRVINDKLAAMPEYSGHIDGVGLSLWRGAYQIYDLRITKRGGVRNDKPLLVIPQSDLSVDWKALFDGKIVASVTLSQPQVNLVMADSPQKSQTKPPESIGETLTELVPLDVNRLQIVSGRFNFLDIRDKPVVDLRLSRLDLTVLGLRTRPGKDATKRPTTGELTAVVQQSGKLKARFRANMFAPDHPDVDGDLMLRNLPLTELRDFTRAYAGFDFEAGTMSVYSELAVGHDDVNGYVKPIISGKKVLDRDENDKGDNVIELAWEGFVAGVTSLLENRGTDDVATRVPIKGKLDNPKVGTWSAVFGLLGNGFLRAILPGIENRVSLADVFGGTSRPTREDISAKEDTTQDEQAKDEQKAEQEAEKRAAKDKADASKEAIKKEKEAQKERAEARAQK